MPQPRQKQLTWDKNGVERMEFFMAEQIAYYILEDTLPEWCGHEDRLIDALRYVQGKSVDGKVSPDYLGYSVAVAGNIMGNMMAQELLMMLLPPHKIAGIVEAAIERAIKDEEYDREFKRPEDYE